MAGALIDEYLLDAIASVLATHALILLALGVMASVSFAVATIVAAILLNGAAEWIARYLRDRLQIRSPAIAVAASAAVFLALGLTFTAALTGFLAIAEQVITSGRLTTFDVLFAQALRSNVTPKWEQFFLYVSRAGATDAILVSTLGIAAALLLKRQFAVCVGWLFTQAGSGLLIHVLKTGFGRARPESAPWIESTWSFPSGHVMGTFVFVGVGSYLLLRRVQSMRLAAAIVAVSVAWCVFISFSRLYLGVHFVSDVIAGAFAGAAWTAICVTSLEMAARIDCRRQTNRECPPTQLRAMREGA